MAPPYDIGNYSIGDLLKCRNLNSGSGSKRQEPIYAKVKKGIRFADDVGDEGGCESGLI